MSNQDKRKYAYMLWRFS